MKYLLLIATLLAGSALHTAQADSARIMLAPGVSL
ncbi:MAG TPA: zinc ABC transporter substrate-binding protein, partial [Erwinia sp.]|nr:zinc ABC transporter substrate-binding protein [Erwinia sp.]